MGTIHVTANHPINPLVTNVFPTLCLIATLAQIDPTNFVGRDLFSDEGHGFILVIID